MVARIGSREHAWWVVDERHGDELIELSEMARHAGPDVAFALFMQGIQSCPNYQAFEAAMRPLFQSGLVVAAKVLHRRSLIDAAIERAKRAGDC